MTRLRSLFSPAQPLPEAEPPVFALPEGTRVYAVGDIHGRSDVLEKMLAAIAQDAREHPTRHVVEIFLGDYIDRGMYSREVIDLLLAPPPTGHERICLMGNHEETLLHFLQDPKILRDWANFGGYATLASYGIPIPDSMSPEKLSILRDALQKNIPETHHSFLRSLKLTHQLGDYLFVHAGIRPHTKLDEQKPQDLLWIRDSFLKHQGFFEQYVVHGHTPIAAPEIRNNRANLDVTGAATNSLCCLVIEGTERRTMLLTQSH